MATKPQIFRMAQKAFGSRSQQSQQQTSNGALLLLFRAGAPLSSKQRCHTPFLEAGKRPLTDEEEAKAFKDLLMEARSCKTLDTDL